MMMKACQLVPTLLNEVKMLKHLIQEKAVEQKKKEDELKKWMMSELEIGKFAVI